MSTAQILYEQYKILPKKVKIELKTLINKENDESLDISLPALQSGLKELKSVLNGTSKTTPIKDFLKELENRYCV
jgi:hypothetical protein